MHSAIYQDTLLRSVALSIARNNVGAMRPESEIISGEGITEQDFAAINKNPQFKKYVDAYTRELSESGFGFAAKSRILAEDLLPIAYHMARDPDTPAAVRAKMLENIVEWGDLKPKKDVAIQNAGAGFSITINLPSENKEPLEIEEIIDIEPENLPVPDDLHDESSEKPALIAEITESAPEITEFSTKIPDFDDLFDDIELGGEDYLV